ncbi:hypothetical protein FOL47_004756 [Perkinsus chesapeaki]|uniref:K Homology domain-containing protein n=1 Tax=Perkinsus chesapeaki TaxID=330153 RepID=A0A7J6MYW4_PERCH|nr:hypothetical protein FOL47_004756 [Perkinsus chesapeaki]
MSASPPHPVSIPAPFSRPPDGSIERVIEVPQKAVGKAIGKGGDVIKRIRGETGARVEVDQSTKDQGFSRFVVSASNPDAVERAVEQLNEIVRSCESCDFLRPGDTERRVPLPEDKVGDVIGPRACVLDELKKRSGCRMDVVVSVPRGEMKYARIVGPPEACAVGAFLVNEVVNGNFDVGGIIHKYSQRTGQQLYDPNHDIRRKGGGPGPFSPAPMGKGNFPGMGPMTPERFPPPQNFAQMARPNLRTSPYSGKGQGHWSRPCENSGNWVAAQSGGPVGGGPYGGSGAGPLPGNYATGGVGMNNSNAMLKFKIPTFAYQKVIGVNNDVLQRIGRDTRSQISELSGRDEVGQATLLIEAPSQTAVDSAVRELEDVIFTCEKPIPGPGESQEFLPMNAADAAKMEGYRSSVIDELKKRSGCRMEITLARPDADADDNMLTIVGSAEQVKIGMMLASQVLSGQLDSQSIESRFKEAHAVAGGTARARAAPAAGQSTPQDNAARRPSMGHRASPY